MARERYLLHTGEDTIHDPDAEKKAEKKVETPRGKWDNFWFYHKIHVLIAVAVLAVVGYTVWTSVQTVKPDYTIGMITQVAYPDEAINTLQTEFAKYGKDLNGDGKVVVQVDQFAIEADTASSPKIDPQMNMANQTKMMADVSSGTSMIFITDDASFRHQEKNGNHMFAYLDGTMPKDSATDFDKMRISMKKCPKLANLKVTISNQSETAKLDFFKDLSLSMRVYKGSGIEGKENDYYNASRALFDKLTK